MAERLVKDRRKKRRDKRSLGPEPAAQISKDHYANSIPQPQRHYPALVETLWLNPLRRRWCATCPAASR